jgi:hypothetical protein
LTRNGSGNLITSAVRIAPVAGTNNTAFTINNLNSPTTDPGDYTLTVDASKLQDPLGNAGLGALSVSWVTDATSADSFVTNLFETVLGRQPDANGLAYWVGQLENGATRLQVSAGIWESAEHRGIEVDGFYATYLHRTADAAGRVYWTKVMLAGTTERDVELDFLTTKEFQADHPAQDALIEEIFSDVLGRRANSGDLAYWEGILHFPGGGEQAVARGILDSVEARHDLIEHYYGDFLGRQANGTELSYWTAVLRSLTYSQVAEQILASQEFFERMS